jgi:hypothetical protein
LQPFCIVGDITLRIEPPLHDAFGTSFWRRRARWRIEAGIAVLTGRPVRFYARQVDVVADVNAMFHAVQHRWVPPDRGRNVVHADNALKAVLAPPVTAARPAPARRLQALYCIFPVRMAAGDLLSDHLVIFVQVRSYDWQTGTRYCSGLLCRCEYQEYGDAICGRSLLDSIAFSRLATFARDRKRGTHSWGQSYHPCQ